jgi:hypothetical protein
MPNTAITNSNPTNFNEGEYLCINSSMLLVLTYYNISKTNNIARVNWHLIQYRFLDGIPINHIGKLAITNCQSNLN